MPLLRFKIFLEGIGHPWHLLWYNRRHADEIRPALGVYWKAASGMRARILPDKCDYHTNQEGSLAGVFQAAVRPVMRMSAVPVHCGICAAAVK